MIYPTRKQRWTEERVARLGFLMGLGWEAKQIAEDSIIASTPGNIYRQASRCDLAFRAAAVAQKTTLPCPLPDVLAPFEAAASKRGLTCEALVHKMFAEIAASPCLIDNILDDGICTLSGVS